MPVSILVVSAEAPGKLGVGQDPALTQAASELRRKIEPGHCPGRIPRSDPGPVGARARRRLAGGLRSRSRPTVRTHLYTVTCTWTGDRGVGTLNYEAYERSYVLAYDGKPDVLGTSDPKFRGDPERVNPEDLMVGALSSCHMLWYLHLCSEAGLVLRAYRDEASATMEMDRNGGRFIEAVLRPRCRFEGPADRELAQSLHNLAHERCFIARSVNFPMRIEAVLEDEAPLESL